MKKYLSVLIVLILYTSVSHAQLEFYYNGSPAAESYTIDSALNTMPTVDDYFIKKLEVMNNGDAPETLEYRRVRIDHTNGWKDQICDDFLCFDTDDTKTWNRPTDLSNKLTLSPGQSSVFQPKVFPKTIAGCVIYRYDIIDTFGQKIDTVLITYKYGSANCFLSTSEIKTTPKVKVYPNPVNNVLNISIETKGNYSTISIYNLVGKEVSKSELNRGTNRLEVSHLSSGVYFYTIKLNDDIIETKKLIIK